MKSETKLNICESTTAAAAPGDCPGGRRPEGQSPGAEVPHQAADIPNPQVKPKQSAPKRTFTTEYKLKILEAYEACDNPLARGELLRTEGLYSSRISSWKQQRDVGRLGIKRNKKTAGKVLQLTRENARLKKKLAQVEAIIELQKKVSELLGQHILPHDLNEEY